MTMDRPVFDERFAQLQEEYHRWLEDHPTASLTEREQALDERLDVLRASLLTVGAQAADPVATCPVCGIRLVSRGSHPRTLMTRGGQELVLDRSYGSCPACGAGLFPPGRDA